MLKNVSETCFLLSFLLLQFPLFFFSSSFIISVLISSPFAHSLVRFPFYVLCPYFCSHFPLWTNICGPLQPMYCLFYICMPFLCIASSTYVCLFYLSFASSIYVCLFYLCVPFLCIGSSTYVCLFYLCMPLIHMYCFFYFWTKVPKYSLFYLCIALSIASFSYVCFSYLYCYESFSTLVCLFYVLLFYLWTKISIASCISVLPSLLLLLSMYCFFYLLKLHLSMWSYHIYESFSYLWKLLLPFYCFLYLSFSSFPVPLKFWTKPSRLSKILK